MTRTLIYAVFLTLLLPLAGCNETLEDIAPKAEKQLPARIVTAMKAKGMSKTSPITMRIFKEEGKLEVWKAKYNGRYEMIADYDICKWSGELGPKFREGDRQAPEGFYRVRPSQMNPKSSYHLSFNMGFPNSYDQANGRTGQHLMVHGACSSAGCYSMTDEQVEEIYAFARDAFRGGQEAFQIQAFPFRMTAENMARYRNDPNYPFWEMLKEGYDHFEITKIPPKVDVCERRYVFNQQAGSETRFVPTAACPQTSQPETLVLAYKKYQQEYNKAFQDALKRRDLEKTRPTIAGTKEALMVADWSKRRARGERVSRLPPSLEASTQQAAAPTSTDAASPVTANAFSQTGGTTAVESALQSASSETPSEIAPLSTGTIPAPTPRPNNVADAGSQGPAGETPPATPTGPVTKVRRSVWNLFSR